MLLVEHRDSVFLSPNGAGCNEVSGSLKVWETVSVDLVLPSGILKDVGSDVRAQSF